MSEPTFANRQPPRKPAALAELTLIVRPKGRPWDIRVFTNVERADAEQYAADNGGIAVEQLSRPTPPAGRGPSSIISSL